MTEQDKTNLGTAYWVVYCRLVSLCVFDRVLPAGYKEKQPLLSALTAFTHSLDPRYCLIVTFDTEYT